MSGNSKKSVETFRVLEIAKLARITLSANEQKKFSQQLGAVLANFQLLQKVDTTKVEATSQVTGLKNVFRDDLISNPKGKKIRDKLLKNAPEVESGLIKVPGVFRND